ncbi:hypothetical protein, partial [Roseibium aestuarii]|uniref:hypothetical protein n=1 Tax=Roseibium aestuarii TaxID=2600299 RepID=UPI001AD8BF8D
PRFPSFNTKLSKNRTEVHTRRPKDAGLEITFEPQALVFGNLERSAPSPATWPPSMNRLIRTHPKTVNAKKSTKPKFSDPPPHPL